VLGGGALFRLTQQLFPKARIVPLETYDALLDHPELDAAVWALDEARAWASGHSGFSAVAASGMGSPLLFAYFLQPNARTLTRYLNTWLSLLATNGFHAEQQSLVRRALSAFMPRPCTRCRAFFCRGTRPRHIYITYIRVNAAPIDV
jgi:hypothetical protein